MYFEYQSILISPHSYITTEQTNGENTLMISALLLELMLVLYRMFFSVTNTMESDLLTLPS